MLINSATLTYVPAGSSSNTSSYSPRSSSRYSSGSACGRLPKILSIKLFCAIWNSHLQSTLNLLRNGHLIVFVLCSSYIDAARSTVIIDVITASFLNEGIAMLFLTAFIAQRSRRYRLRGGRSAQLFPSFRGSFQYQ